MNNLQLTMKIFLEMPNQSYDSNVIGFSKLTVWIMFSNLVTLRIFLFIAFHIYFF